MAASSAGCVITSDTTQLGHIAATWHVDSVDAMGNVMPTSCPMGIDTAVLHTVAANADGTAVEACTDEDASCYIDLFDCDADGGQSAPLPAQSYLTWIELTSHDGSISYATSTAGFVNITDVDMNFDTEILADGGYFKLTWSLIGASSGQPISCAGTAAAQGAGGSIETTATLTGSTAAFADQFDCEDRFGYSDPLPSGTYTIEVDALDSADTAISEPTTLTNAIGTDPNTITDLGHIMIPLTGM